MDSPKAHYIYTETLTVKIVVVADSADAAEEQGIEYVGTMLNYHHRDMLFKQCSKRLGIVRMDVESENTQATKMP